jgi:hypothetical protein
MPVINDYLQNLYQRAFEEEQREMERVRGGETPEPSNQGPIPTEAEELSRQSATEPPSFDGQPGEPERDFVDTPLDRPEVREALEDGASLEEALGSDGRLEELREKAEDLKGDD